MGETWFSHYEPESKTAHEVKSYRLSTKEVFIAAVISKEGLADFFLLQERIHSHEYP